MLWSRNVVYPERGTLLSLCADPPSPQEKSGKGRLWFTVVNRVWRPRDFSRNVWKWFDWLLVVDHYSMIGFRARRQNIACSIVCSYSDPGISEKRKETEIFIERFFSRTKKL